MDACGPSCIGVSKTIFARPRPRPEDPRTTTLLNDCNARWPCSDVHLHNDHQQHGQSRLQKCPDLTYTSISIRLMVVCVDQIANRNVKVSRPKLRTQDQTSGLGLGGLVSSVSVPVSRSNVTARFQGQNFGPDSECQHIGLARSRESKVMSLVSYEASFSLNITVCDENTVGGHGWHRGPRGDVGLAAACLRVRRSAAARSSDAERYQTFLTNIWCRGQCGLKTLD